MIQNNNLSLVLIIAIIVIALNFTACKDDPITYMIAYNANGGNGTMESSIHIYDMAKNLSINTFTRAGYAFAGWATSPAGAMIYTDMQSVINVSSTNGATVTLYAIWDIITVVPGANLAEKLAWMQTNAQSGVEYTIRVNDTANESIGPTTLSYGEKNNISIILNGNNRIVDLSSNGSLFTVGNGVTLILTGVTLRGRSNNDAPLVRVNSGGTLMMSAAHIFGSAMIRDNINTALNGRGGGVHVNGGTFVFTNGWIGGHYASFGGGVCVDRYGTFLFGGGTIYGSNEISNVRNTAEMGAALATNAYFSTYEHGIFIDGVWNKKGDLSASNNTLRVNIYGELF